ncbi:MAG: pyruvate kinase [Armatimonadetes bacterium]|nr:pyruvate kinase [Armatimonadota bacterium]MDW8029784.1 pyruvate kinase [Armatimonadota bacterium]
MRRTKIVATVGPATMDEEKLMAILKAGVDVVRINCSHGTMEQHRKIAETVRKISNELGKPVALLWDLQGPRIRIAELKQPIELVEGSEVVLTAEPDSSEGVVIPVEAPYLATSVKQGQKILIDEGRIELETIFTDGVRVKCKVIRGGVVKSRKGINLPGAKLAVPILSEEDLRDLRNGIQAGTDFVAMSFVRSAEDIETLRMAIQAHGADVPIIAKLERPEAIERLDEILKAADGVMVARGDLGVEMPLEKVPIAQKRIIAEANRKFVPVITATQMLESMMELPRPTRAEASDVANAILDGTDAVMLSGETAVGKYPVEAVTMMQQIILASEEELFRKHPIYEGRAEGEPTIAHAISDAACLAASDINAKAIVVFTKSGLTALLVSKRRPKAPIIAFTPSEQVQRRLNLLWGVIPKFLPFAESTDKLLAMLDDRLIEEGLAEKGDVVVIVAGIPIPAKGQANFLKIHQVGSGA